MEDLKEEMQEHLSDSKRIKNLPLYKAIRKYGWENFQKEIIMVCKEEDVNYYETNFIRVYKNSGKSYNISLGGESGFRGMKHTEESKRKIAEKRIGKKASQKTIELLKVRMSGENNPMFGKKHSYSTKQKISKSRKGIGC